VRFSRTRRRSRRQCRHFLKRRRERRESSLSPEPILFEAKLMILSRFVCYMCA
jgi:hypothetical protein